MRLALEFRGVPEAPDRTPLLIGCSMAVIPGAMLLLAAFTGHMGDETPTTVQGWFTMAAAAAGMGAAFAALGAFVSFLFRRLQVGLAAGHLVRVDADGLEIRYRGRTWRGPWGAIALDWREDDEGSKYLVFCAPSGRMEYPYLVVHEVHGSRAALAVMIGALDTRAGVAGGHRVDHHHGGARVVNLGGLQREHPPVEDDGVPGVAPPSADESCCG